MTEPRPDLTDPDAATAVALLRASLTGDADGVNAIVATTDPYALTGVMAALALALGLKACDGDPDALDTLLVEWQQRERAA